MKSGRIIKAIWEIYPRMCQLRGQMTTSWQIMLNKLFGIFFFTVRQDGCILFEFEMNSSSYITRNAVTFYDNLKQATCWRVFPTSGSVSRRDTVKRAAKTEQIGGRKKGLTKAAVPEMTDFMAFSETRVQ